MGPRARLDPGAPGIPLAVVGVLVSVNVGKPKDVEWRDRTVHTGVWKTPRGGRLAVRKLNVDGDGQGDLLGHGGPHRAVLVYQTAAYAHWAAHFGWDHYANGLFGENLTVDGMRDDEVYVGDRYRIGTAVFEVSQPRVTCFRVGMRVGQPTLPALMVSHGRPGFYMRVLEEGEIAAGDAIVRLGRGRDPLSIAEVDALLYLPNRDRDQLARVVDNPALSPGWQQSFRELLASPVSVVDRPESAASGRRPAVGAWAGFRDFEVSEVVRETPVVTSLCLTPSDGAPLPPYRAGQYLTLRVPDVGGASQDGGRAGFVRSYSLSTAARPDRYRISVKREPHGLMSGYLSGVRRGDRLLVAAPRGDFTLAVDAKETRPLVLASAGIGLTPLLAMLQDLVRRRSSRPVIWLHAARSPSEHAFRDEAQRLLDLLPGSRAYVFYSRAAPADGTDGEPPGSLHVVQGRRMDASALEDVDVPADADVYVCGPTGFMTDLRAYLTDHGIPPERVHVELFGALDPINPGVVGAVTRRPHPPPGHSLAEAMYQVTFTRSGLEVDWAPDRGTLLELAEACDVPTRWACRTGVCHTCVTPVVSGDVEYVVPPLEPPAPGEALLCCSRPRGDLVLEL